MRTNQCAEITALGFRDPKVFGQGLVQARLDDSSLQLLLSCNFGPSGKLLVQASVIRCTASWQSGYSQRTQEGIPPKGGSSKDGFWSIPSNQTTF